MKIGRWRRNWCLARLLVLAAVALIAAIAAPSSGSAADTEQVLYNFCSQNNCADGMVPSSGVIRDGSGNLYGAAFGGNTCTVGALLPTCGVVFELTPNGTETVLHTFCSQLRNNTCADGQAPNGLIMDAAGNLYGTAEFGGPGSGADQGCALNVVECGVVFELTPNQTRTAWTETVLYNFCSKSQCGDGAFPLAGLIMDASGNLYGTTSIGGIASGTGCDSGPSGGCGVVFELTPNAARTVWTETVLYNFCSQSNCSDGRAPNTSLIMDGAGNLYGTAAGGNSTGGLGGAGVAFELTANQARTAWTETVLYNFCSQNNCSDGTSPVGGLTMDAAGNLYGTTEFGGTNANGCETGTGCGVAFELTPNQARTAWTESGLYTFCSQSNCSDGAAPISGLTMDAAGNLYGLTVAGGTGDSAGGGGGVAFELTPNGNSRTETVLYAFCSQSNCTDGESPGGSLIMDGAGNLYGTTQQGGNAAVCSGSDASADCGTVFELLPSSTCPSGGAVAAVGRSFIAPGTPTASPLVAAVLPESRSVQVCATATAFATIINSGGTAATGCSIAPATSVPTNFLYQTTNPTTNALTGTANTPVDIAAGAAQSFVIALTPSAAFAATNVDFNFACANAAAAPIEAGLDTLLFSASTSPVPDIVALGATVSNDGILHINGSSGSNAFAVATVNLGAGDAITASINTGGATLPLGLALCQTNPSTGQCISPVGATVTTTIAADATPTFGIFGNASGAIPFDPANSRIFVQFNDSAGAVRGETSVAVETQ
jgi:hypothetical protein